MSSARCGWHQRCSSRLLSSPLHYAKRNENRPIRRPVVSVLGPAKVCLSCPPSLTYTLTFLRFLSQLLPFGIPLLPNFLVRCTPDGLYLSTPPLSLALPLSLSTPAAQHIHSLLNKSPPPFFSEADFLSLTTLSTTDRTENRDTPL